MRYMILGTLALSIMFGSAVARTRQVALTEPGFTATLSVNTPDHMDSGQRVPAVLLLGGSGAADADFTILDNNGKAKSQVGLDLRNAISSYGFIAASANKRFVKDAWHVDGPQFGALTLTDFLDDAERALALLKQQPDVDPARIFIYGWSEGSTIAWHLAARHPELSGLILQAPVTQSWAHTLKTQFTRVGVPYLRHFAIHGEMSLIDAAAAMLGPGGDVAQRDSRLLFARRASKVGFRDMLDPDNRGVLKWNSLADAADPLFVDTPGNLGPYSSAFALPPLQDSASSLQMPSLIVQGLDDASIDPRDVTAFNESLPATASHTLLLFGHLGHTLGKASSPELDNFAPMASEPLTAICAWLIRHTQ